MKKNMLKSQQPIFQLHDLISHIVQSLQSFFLKLKYMSFIMNIDCRIITRVSKSPTPTEKSGIGGVAVLLPTLDIRLHQN